MGRPLQKVLNDLAGTRGMPDTKAANLLAGTSGLELVEALNVMAGTRGLGLDGVLNRLALDQGVADRAGMGQDKAANALAGPVVGNALIPQTGLELWLDARYPAGVGGALPADGTPLQTWVDLSGNGRNATQGTEANRPLFRAAHRNLLTYNQATVETDVVGFSNMVAGQATTRSTTVALHGVACLRLGRSSTTGDVGVAANPYPQVVAGQTYTVTAWVRPTIASAQARINVERRNVDGSATGVYYHLPSYGAVAQNEWTLLTATFTATHSSPVEIVVRSNSSYTTEDYLYIDQLGIWEGTSTTWVPPVALPNGQPTIQFDGGNDGMVSGEFPSMSSSGGCSIYTVVARENRDHTAHARVYAVTGGVGVNMRLRIDAPTEIFYISTASGDRSLGPASLDPLVFSHVTDATTLRAYRNGTLAVAGTAATGAWEFVNPTLRIGDGDAVPAAVRYSAVLVYSEAHDIATRQKIERALGAQFGVTVA